MIDNLKRAALFMRGMVLCPLFGACGGCTLQHLDYNIQVESKRKALVDAVGLAEVAVYPSKEFSYRNRMEFLLGSNGLGLRKRGKPGEIVAVQNCPIVEDNLNQSLSEVFEFCSPELKGALRGVVIRGSGGATSVSFVLNKASSRLREAAEAIRGFKGTSTNILGTYASGESNYSEEYFIIRGTDMLKSVVLGKEFIYHVQGFFQNNTAMAEAMQGYCKKLITANNTRGSHLLDLYSGVGVFGVTNSEFFNKVTMVESAGLSVGCARLNIKANVSNNISVFKLDSSQIGRLKLPEGLWVITDPPRTSMDMKTINQLKRLKPNHIIYVSCNLEQLRKDIKKFKEFSVKSAALFDFFPQTPHCESVVELLRR